MLEKFSLVPSLVNVLPLVLLSIGLVRIAQMLNRKSEVAGELAYTGITLVLAGNVLSAVGKFLNAKTGSNITWMESSLLFFSAPGFMCLAWATWRSKLKELTAGKVWLLPIFFNGGLLALTAATKMVKGGQTWQKLLLIVATIASIALFMQLALMALQRQQQVFAMLFILSLGMSLALILRGNDHSAAAEWAQLISNTIAQAVFAFAAVKLAKIES